MKKHALLIAFGSLVLGCGSVRTEHVLTGRQLPAHQGDVQIIMEGAAKPGPVQEIAIVQVYATGTKAELPPALEGLKTKARSLGCDVVVNVRVDRGQNMSVTGVCGRLSQEPPPAQQAEQATELDL